MFKRIISTDDAWTGLILRVPLGFDMLYHGLQKAFGLFNGNGFKGTVDYFSTLGISFTATILVIFIETICSIMLMLGFLGRINAALIFIVMIGALITVHWENGFSINWLGNQKGEGFELDVLMYAMCGVLIINGSGILSIDRLISEKRK